MPKRKRNEIESAPRENSSPNSATTNQRKRAEEKLFHGKKVLHRALKLAKGFERQKLSRRRKSAVKEPAGAIARIDAEIEALKTLDLVWATENHLYRTLLKNKAISQSRYLPEQVAIPTRSVPSGPVANVTARLYNSNPVKEAMGETVVAVRLALGLGAQAPPKKNQAPVEEPASKVPAKVANDAISADSDSDGSLFEGSDFENAHGSMEGKSSSEEESVPESEESFAEFDDRVAGSADDSSEDLGSDSAIKRDAKKRSAYLVDVELSPSPFPSPSGSISESFSELSKVEVVGGTTNGAGRSMKASFLPSLTMGGYWSGSEGEEASDVDDAPRKNRRGQRARQKIWEQKYGQKAKHLQKEAQAASHGTRDQRDKGWDMKRGAQEEGGSGYKAPWTKSTTDTTRGPKNVASGSNSTQLKPRLGMNNETEKADKPLHPSWEAAMKAKEKRADTIPFAGKKVVFD